jgi:hypothetical protein
MNYLEEKKQVNRLDYVTKTSSECLEAIIFKNLLENYSRFFIGCLGLISN